MNGEIFYSMNGAARAGRYAGASTTTTPSDLTLSLGYRSTSASCILTEASRGMEKWKAKNASHFPTPPTAAASYLNPTFRVTLALTIHW